MSSALPIARRQHRGEWRADGRHLAFGHLNPCDDGMRATARYARHAATRQLLGAQGRDDDKLKRPEFGRRVHHDAPTETRTAPAGSESTTEGSDGIQTPDAGAIESDD